MTGPRQEHDESKNPDTPAITEADLATDLEIKDAEQADAVKGGWSGSTGGDDLKIHGLD